MVTVSITAPVAGSYSIHSLRARYRQIKGNNAAPAVATLTVSPVITSVVSVWPWFTPGTVQITRGVPVTVMLDVVTDR